MAEAFGKQLIEDQEVVGFDEILNKIRVERTNPTSWFNCVQFDNLLRTIQEHDSASPANRYPTIEITSIAPQGGKTHLLYLLTSIAVTPSKHGGREACVAIVDADKSFEISRLVQQIRLRLESRTTDLTATELDELINHALDHVYILKPEGTISLSATIADLPNWFLGQKHRSLDRAMAFLAIDSISTPQAQDSIRDPHTLYTRLFTEMKASGQALQCPVIYTSRYQGQLPKLPESVMPHSLRTDHPASQFTSLQLIVRRVPVRSIPSSLPEEEVAREIAERMKIVALGRFECVVNEHGLDSRVIESLRNSEDGFYFRITQEGLTMDVVSNQG